MSQVAKTHDAVPDPLQLISIKPSHFVERARWALDLSELPYQERAWPPGMHRIAVGRAGSDKTTVPVLVTPDKGVLSESADIVLYASTHSKVLSAQQLYPTDPLLRNQVEEWDKKFERLGVWSRSVLYQHLFQLKNEITVQCLCQGASSWATFVFRMVYPVLKLAMARGMNINATSAKICLGKIQALFEEVGTALEGGARRYLVGDHLTAADIAFASLSAPVLLPEQYGAAMFPCPVFPPEMLDGLRSSVAGKYALELYRCDRWPATGA